MREFKTYHPLVNFVYFLFVIVFSCICMHPIMLFISLFCSFSYLLLLKGKKAMKNLLYVVVFMIVAALLNTLFNHRGATILAYFPDGNPFTLQSVIYGFSSAAMVASVLLWFLCFNEIMESDKLIFLFSKIFPSLSLVFTMTLRFAGRLFNQTKNIADAQSGIGLGAQNKGILKKAKYGMDILSAVASWAMENSIETADSMKSRGYGLIKRTSFSIYSFDRRDGIAFAFIVISGLYTLLGAVFKKMQFDYFPYIDAFDFSFLKISFFASFGILCALPIIIEIREARKWKATESKI